VAGVTKHTIIGNSAAGLSAIKAIRKSGDSRHIVLISREKCPAYSPVLTTYYIGGRIERTRLFLVDDDFYRRHKVQTIFGRRVVEVDTGNRRLHLDDRSRLEYDSLLVASGASARSLDTVEPDASPYVSTLRTVQDADKIKTAMGRAKAVAVTGAGLVSLQTVRAVLGRGLKITALVGSEQVLSQQMDKESASIIQEKLEAEGVKFLFGRNVERVYKKGGRAQVVTSYGESLPADLVVVGKGVRPNMEMIRDTAIKTNTGILIDDRMRTSVQDVYAAGDVAEAKNDITGETEVIATWFNACAQGETAGLNMADRPARLRGRIRENVTTIAGVAVASIGESNPDYGRYREIRHVDPGRCEVRKLYLDGPHLVGALLIGNTDDAGIIRYCIANRVDISPWKDKVVAAAMDFGEILCGQGLRWPHFNQ
jgi:nitrite reductase (NADH) large subunit